jgi:acetyltransferase
MEQPISGLPLDPPPAAFLAQHALLRAKNAKAWLARLEDLPLGEIDVVARNRAHEVLRDTGPILSDHESKVVLRGFGFEITRQAVATSASAAAHFAETIGYPVVLKPVSPDLRRKSELGTVRLGLTSAAIVRRDFAAILSSLEKSAPEVRVDGVLVAEMVPQGLEVECGAIRLRDGSYACYARPVGIGSPVEPVFARGPMDRESAILLSVATLARVGAPALRRTSDPDVGLLATVFLRLGGLFEATGSLLEQVELDPLRLIDLPRAITLDARITKTPEEPILR